MKLISVSDIVCLVVSIAHCGTPKPPEYWPVQIAESFIARHPDGIMQVEWKSDIAWTYEQGLMLEAFRQMGRFTSNRRYDDFIRQNRELYVRDNGSIRTYRLDDYNLDMIAGGRGLLFLLETTGHQSG